jgi:hypothetical protein
MTMKFHPSQLRLKKGMISMANPDEKSEVERLVYRGYNIPKFLRLAWTCLVVFSLYYLILYSLPDLKHWLGLLKNGGQ